MDEVAGLELQNDLVDGVEQSDDPTCQGIVDEVRLVDVRWPAQECWNHRPSRFEARICTANGEIVLEDSHELAEVRVHPITTRAFTLLADHLDRQRGRRHLGPS